MSADPIESFFAPDGPLARTLDGYEQRVEQVAVARRVAAVIRGRGKLVAEAGTGVGKTLAYLVPAVTSQLKVVISTGTKNLQDQILTKDLPIIERALGLDIDVQVMKGRTNYLCEQRAGRIGAQPNLPGVQGDADLETVMAWRRKTETGDRSELTALPDDSRLWRELTVSSEQCLGRQCADFERCWVTLMRRRAQTAQLLIVNHHLYFADVALHQRLGDSGVSLLPPHDLVIFDEAHDLDEVAAQHFGFQVSDRRILDLGYDVQRAVGGDPSLTAQIKPIVDRLARRTAALFDALPNDSRRTPLSAEVVSPVIVDRVRDVDAQLELLESVAASDEMASIEEGPAMGRRTGVLAAELAFILGIPRRSSLVAEIDLPAPSDGSFVRYAERSGRTRSLVARPIDVAETLRDWLDELPAIFVSATLTVGGEFDHFRSRLGLVRTKELLVGSPFDYQQNARLYLPDDLPLPGSDAFPAAAAERAAELVAASGGGAFVLCTGHRSLPIMRAAIERHAELHGATHGNIHDILVLMQGEAPRSRLIDQFRRDGHAVLVATMSFWQGVDVPGAALRVVVIDRLPFASPGDALIAARLDYLRKSGEDPFMSYQVPQAALLLRQGFGRLIRRQTDRGLVAILDGRIRKRHYGRVFLDSLPDCPRLTELDDATAFVRSLNHD
ncbi:MAG: ATP-dependent DNA helicase [Myxococcota bacterium]